MRPERKTPRAADRSKAKARTAAWEWGIAACGLAFVLLVLLELGWTAAFEQRLPAQLSASPISIEKSGSGFLLRFEVANDGDETAARLLVSGTLRRDGAAVERSEAVIDYVPAHSTRRGGLMFRLDPSAYELILRPEGYSDP